MQADDPRVAAELLSKRVALTHYLAEQLHNLGQRQAAELEERREAAWNREMATKGFAELPEQFG